jgi:hypothetical protein
MISRKGLLFIEPIHPASSTPIVDHLTRRMAAAFRLARADDGFYLGFHKCVCGAYSTNHNYTLPNWRRTNSLCVHYVAYRRAEIPARQLAIIERLTSGEVQPSNLELEGSRYEFSETLREAKSQLHELTAVSHLERKWWQFWK